MAIEVSGRATYTQHILDAEYEVSELKNRLLLDCGWTRTSSTPGSYILWTREWEGKSLMVSTDMAFSMQRVHIEEDPHEWDEDGTTCTNCGTTGCDESPAIECLPE